MKKIESECKRISLGISLLPRKAMDQKEQEFVRRYLGTGKDVFGVKTYEIMKVAKKEAKKLEDCSKEELVELLDKLFSTDVLEEHLLAAKIYCFLKPERRSGIPFVHLEKWLKPANGWLEVDCICQNSLSAAEVMGRRDEWIKAIKQFSQSKTLAVRRASLVLQVRSNSQAKDKELRQLAFNTIEKLKPEKEIMITKSISWLLRSLSEQDKNEVKAYLLANKTTLPSIAFRETMKKIETGKKNGPRK